MPELTVIVPFVNEYPQVAFTLRSIMADLDDRVDYEVVAVDNYCEQVKSQGREEDKGGKHVQGFARVHPRLRYINYKDKLSHWNAKRVAVEASTSPFLLFIDAHCVPDRDALYHHFTYYRDHHQEMHGTQHLPLTYHILENRKLIYSLQVRRQQGHVHYTFSSYREPGEEVYEVPCMSTCGMIMSREIWDAMRGLPPELGIYGGGENYINYVLAVLGYKKWIKTGGALHHHGEKRGYSYEHGDYLKNRALALYCAGGMEYLKRFMAIQRGNRLVLQRIRDEVLVEQAERRAYIEDNTVISLDDWLDKWGVEP